MKKDAVDHPKMKRLARLLGWGRMEIVGSVELTLIHAQKFAPSDGVFDAKRVGWLMDELMVEEEKFKKWLAAMVDAGWLERIDAEDGDVHYAVHDWDDHKPRYIKDNEQRRRDAAPTQQGAAAPRRDAAPTQQGAAAPRRDAAKRSNDAPLLTQPNLTQPNPISPPPTSARAGSAARRNDDQRTPNEQTGGGGGEKNQDSNPEKPEPGGLRLSGSDMRSGSGSIDSLQTQHAEDEMCLRRNGAQVVHGNEIDDSFSIDDVDRIAALWPSSPAHIRPNRLDKRELQNTLTTFTTDPDAVAEMRLHEEPRCRGSPVAWLEARITAYVTSHQATKEDGKYCARLKKWLAERRHLDHDDHWGYSSRSVSGGCAMSDDEMREALGVSSGRTNITNG